ncbi:MAG: endonuclease domain-containing protein, partial [Chloroflexi bacterium]|nr:endonuclease domain-containing protein [Chloroflexota bacterium]
MLPYNSKVKRYARELRRDMTDAERRLWSKIRMKQLNGYQFYRQRTIGDYIVDFYCPTAKLVIEVDGSRHDSLQGMEADRRRDEYPRKLGLKVLRFNDIDVLNNIEGVGEIILENMNDREWKSPFRPTLVQIRFFRSELLTTEFGQQGCPHPDPLPLRRARGMFLR